MMNLFNSHSIPAFLEVFFYNKKIKNPRYSKRAFARDLKISAGRLTELLNGKRNMTFRVAQSISQALKLATDEESHLYQLVGAQKNLKTKKLLSRVLISGDRFFELSNWKYYALMCLIEQPRNGDSLNYFSKKLNIDIDVCREMLLNLERQKMITKSEEGYKILTESTTTGQDVSSLEIKKFHEDLIKEHLRLVKSVSVDRREVQSLILTLDKKDLARAKKMVRAFVDKFQSKISGKKKSEVYAMTILLNPLFE